MQKRLPIKHDHFFNTFKDALTHQMISKGIPDDINSDLLQFIYDYPNLELAKEDFQKRKRVKNSVPWHERCSALKAEGIQCTRRRKDTTEFCGTHLKGTPHGIVNNDKPVKSEFTKISVIPQEIDGIIYNIDDHGNIYDPQDIHQNLKNPKVIAKYEKNTEGNIYLLK